MLSLTRFEEFVATFRQMRIVVVGDFCLDRYLEIDFRRQEISLETGLPVWNVVQVRPQPGGCGTIVNNLVALGVREIHPVGFFGFDGEGWELHDQLSKMPGVQLDHFHQTAARRTFTYTKPMSVTAMGPPQELNRIDIKNWTPTPSEVSRLTGTSLRSLVQRSVDGVIVLDQCDTPNVGVVTDELLIDLQHVLADSPELVVVADSRSGLRRFPPVTWKMNRNELQNLLGEGGGTASDLATTRTAAANLAQRNKLDVCVTMAELGIVAASRSGDSWYVPSPPVEGPIDVVGAGDAVTATFTLTRAAGGNLEEAIQMAVLAGHVVVHQLGTTGTAQPALMKSVLQSYVT